MKQFKLNEYLANPSRKVVTRDGHSVRIICTDAMSIHPVVALVRYDNDEDIESYSSDGKWSNKPESALDLFFAPEKRGGWVSVYRNVRGNIFFSSPYCTKEEALDALYDDTDTRIDTIKVEWEE